MAKIKSTLDLIMEKTGHLSLDQEEKEAIKKQELAKKVRGFTLMFLNGERDANALAQQFDTIPAEQKDEATRLCLDLFLENITPFENNHRILKGVEILQGEIEHKRWQETIEHHSTLYLKELEEMSTETVSQLIKDFAAIGLAGPALLPAMEQSAGRHEEKQRVTSAFQEAVRKALHSTP